MHDDPALTMTPFDPFAPDLFVPEGRWNVATGGAKLDAQRRASVTRGKRYTI